MIPIAKPLLDEREAAAASRVILSGWITQGPEVAAFEQDFAAYVQAPFACAVSNCTTALHLALLAAGVGGMITTKHKSWDQKFRLWRQHGMSISDTVRHSSNQVIFESYSEVGFNYRMTDIQAAVGREQLKRLPQIISQRRHLAHEYHR